jgi:hypothetical protein
MKSQKKRNIPQSAVKLAQALLKRDEESLEELWMHDEAAHDDELTERLYTEFSAEVEGIQAELAKSYGPPARTGKKDDRLIPLNGVFRFAIWKVAGRQLFVAAHHEDRGVPIILWLGTVSK